MKIINAGLTGDYHIHTSTISDGLNSLDEMVVQAGKLKLKEIAVTDHSQAYMHSHGMKINTHYNILSSGRWKNIHNTVNVIFGVEADLLNERGDMCDDIQGICPEFVILSTHKNVYRGDLEKIKKGYLAAIDRHGSRINLLGHLYSRSFSQFLNPDDILEVVNAANSANIAMELNCSHLVNAKICEANLKAMLTACEFLYVNSDAHTLYELSDLRREGFKYLSEVGGQKLVPTSHEL